MKTRIEKARADSEQVQENIVEGNQGMHGGER